MNNNGHVAVARAVGATKIYGSGEAQVLALDDVTVDFPAGCYTAIMGPSGSGKSTLMHCVAGLDNLTSGQVFLGDVELGKLSDKELTLLRREKIGFVFQAFNLVGTLTALENITLPMALAGTKPDQAFLDRVIDTVGLRNRLTHRPSELSGGQQQRVAVARAKSSSKLARSVSPSTSVPDRKATPRATAANVPMRRRLCDQRVLTVSLNTPAPQSPNAFMRSRTRSAVGFSMVSTILPSERNTTSSA